MKCSRIQAIILRHFFVFRKNLDHLTGVFYWPAISLLLWGLTSSYFESQSIQGSGIIFAIVSGILFWLIVERGNMDITFSALQELWDKNLINIFGTPLMFAEWICAFFIITVIKTIISFFFALFLAFVLYHTHIFSYGFLLIPFGLSLMMTGWWIGCFIAGLILRYGTKVQALAWTVPAVIAPFAAIYYPVSALPPWAQYIATILPVSYIFESMRTITRYGIFNANDLFISIVLNVCYLACSLLFLRASFRKVLSRGLLKIY